MKSFALKVFFRIPIWFLKILYFNKKSVFRGHQFDIQSQALINLQPKIDLTEIPDDEIHVTRNLIIENRIKNRLSLYPNMPVKTVDNYINDTGKLLLREYTPSEISSQKAILFFHGGGYVLNSVSTHDLTVSYMADRLQTKIYSLDYSLAPESKYPVALDEARQAFDWLQTQGYQASDISLCGDSAGAHLAASLVHKILHSDSTKIPDSQFLIYPMCDPACDSESFNALSDGYLLTQRTMVWFWKKLGNNLIKDNDDSFNLLKLDSNSKLPNTIVVTAGFDPLCDDGESYAFLLHKRGDVVKQLHYPKMFHGFASVTRLKAAKKAVDDFLAEYKKIL